MGSLTGSNSPLWSNEILPSEVSSMERNMRQPLFTEDGATHLSLPEVVYIVGTGDMGFIHHDSIPKDAYTIAVNQAIAYRDINFNAHFISDSTVHEEGWFHKYKNTDLTRIYSKELVENTNAHHEFWFEQRLPFGRAGKQLKHGCCRPNGSVSISCLQMCYWCGVKTVWLCGVDMSGRYFVYNRVGNMVIQEMRENGVNVHSLSATNLNVEYDF